MEAQLVEFDPIQMIWDGRWMALEMFWNGIVMYATTFWWFGPLLVFILLAAGWRKVLRLGAHIGHVFARSKLDF